MLMTEKGQVTIAKPIRVAAGVAPGSEVSFSLIGSRIVITPVRTGMKEDRRGETQGGSSPCAWQLRRRVQATRRG